MTYPTQDSARYGGERPEPPLECIDCGQMIHERDVAQEAADGLVNAIERLLDVDCGEHSNLNCPWQNALAFVEGEISSKSQTKE